MASIIEQIEITSKGDEGAYPLLAKELLDCFANNNFIAQQELADKCYCSIATVTNFAKSFSLLGYRELITRLKVEREKYFYIKQEDEIESTTSSKISFETALIALEFVKSKADFIQNLVETIYQSKKLIIYSSSQLLESVTYLSKALSAIDITTKIVDINLEYQNLNSIQKQADQSANLFVISGRDTGFLIDYFLINLFRGKAPFVITTTSQINKLKDIDLSNTITFDYKNDDSSYAKRSLVATTLFNIIIENIEKKYNSYSGKK